MVIFLASQQGQIYGSFSSISDEDLLPIVNALFKRVKQAEASFI